MSQEKRLAIGVHHNVIARYLHSRVCLDGPDYHPWIATIRDTSRMLAKYTNSRNDPAKYEFLERTACACLAHNRGMSVFTCLQNPRYEYPVPSEGGMDGNCLAVAAWMGDLDLVKSLHKGSDPLAFFGRPSWAAATQGHLEILQFCLDNGALPYEPTFSNGPSFNLDRSSLASAAFMGHENIVKFFLQYPHYRSRFGGEEAISVYFAAQGNHANTLRIMLEHSRKITGDKEFMSRVDWSLVVACRRGAFDTAKVALEEYGASILETDKSPRSCLQLAVRASNPELVKLLLDAGAPLKADGVERQRFRDISKRMTKRRDALTEAKKRDHPTIIRLIEEAAKSRGMGAQDGNGSADGVPDCEKQGRTMAQRARKSTQTGAPDQTGVAYYQMTVPKAEPLFFGTNRGN